MLQDLDRDMEKWGTTGQFDPFDNIYKVSSTPIIVFVLESFSFSSKAVFQLTVRALACREIADSQEVVQRVAKLYWDIGKGTTATAVLLPWFPSPSRKRKEKANTELYMLLKGVLDKRIEEGRVEEDPAQALLDDGDSVDEIVTFIMRGLFTGISKLSYIFYISLLLKVRSSQHWYHG